MSPALKQATDDYMKLINAQENTDDQDKFLALAKAGFAMASSGSPYLLQAVGQGGNAGIDAYQAARAKAAERRLRGAQGTLEVAKIGEEVRRAAAREGLDRDRLEVDRTRYAAAERRSEKELGLAEQTLAEKVRQFNAGQATEREKIDAERGYREAQANYYNAYADATRSGARFAGSTRTPARIAEANALVSNGVAPDFESAYRMVRTGTNSLNQYTMRVQAEMKRISDGIGGYKFSQEELEELAIKSIERIANGRDLSGTDIASPPATPVPAAAAPPPGATIRYDSQGIRQP
jgi:hypothetical protein